MSSPPRRTHSQTPRQPRPLPRCLRAEHFVSRCANTRVPRSKNVWFLYGASGVGKCLNSCGNATAVPEGFSVRDDFRCHGAVHDPRRGPEPPGLRDDIPLSAGISGPRHPVPHGSREIASNCRYTAYAGKSWVTATPATVS